MGEFIPGKWDIVVFYIKRAINNVNSKIDASKVRERFSMQNEERSCRMTITDLGTLCLVTNGSRVDIVEKIEIPTSIITMDEDTFIQMRKGIMTFDDAYWYGQMSVEGEFWLRDLVIFSEMFKEFGALVIDK